MAVDAPPDSDEHYVRSIEAGVFRTLLCRRVETNYQAGQGLDWRATGLSCWTETAQPERMAAGRCGDQPRAVICWRLQ